MILEISLTKYSTSYDSERFGGSLERRGIDWWVSVVHIMHLKNEFNPCVLQ